MSLANAIRALALAGAAIAAITTAAVAHHGWSWAEDGQIELTGIIASIEISPPHPVLQVDADGQMWTVELGNPSQTERSGFGERSAAVGDEIVALGNRSSDASENRMKAVRLTVGDTVYDIYPDRIQAN